MQGMKGKYISIFRDSGAYMTVVKRKEAIASVMSLIPGIHRKGTVNKQRLTRIGTTRL